MFQQLLTPAAGSLGLSVAILPGSDTSGNALFGNLQVVASKQLGLDPMHSTILALFLGLLVALQQYAIPWIIPTVGGTS
jgi:L-lactate permease